MKLADDATWMDALRELERLLVEKTGRTPAVVRIEVTEEAWKALASSDHALFMPGAPHFRIPTKYGSSIEVCRAAQATAPHREERKL